MVLRDGATPKLEPISEAGSGSVQEREKALLQEIIQKVNDLFEGELTDQDKLVYVNNVIKGKLLESETLRQQAANNTKEQFANSPDLKTELLNAIMDALAAHTTMSKQALNSPTIQGRDGGHFARPRGALGDVAGGEGGVGRRRYGQKGEQGALRGEQSRLATA